MIAYQSTVLMHCKSENMSHRRRIAETITATAVALSANVRQGPIPPGDQRCVPGLFSPNIRMFMVSTKVIVLALCVLEVALGVFHVQADHDGSGPSGSADAVLLMRFRWFDLNFVMSRAENFVRRTARDESNECHD